MYSPCCLCKTILYLYLLNLISLTLGGGVAWICFLNIFVGFLIYLFCLNHICANLQWVLLS